MNVKMSDLSTLERCEKRYQINRLGIVTKKGKNYFLSIAMREAVKHLLLLNDSEFKSIFSIKYIFDYLNSKVSDDLFVPLAKKEILNELSLEIERYVLYVKNAGGVVIGTDIIQDINICGKLVTVTADLVIKHESGIAVVKLRKNEPELSYAARNFENKPHNNIELYLLQAVGEYLYPNETVIGSFHHMTSKNDKKDFIPVYNSKKGYNIISYQFDEKEAESIEGRVKELFVKLNSDKFNRTCNSQECETCSYKNICYYKKSQELALRKIEEVNKAPKDFTLTKTQRSAVLQEDGIIRINAGAGSGKTTVVALRVAELIIAGCKPEDILLITFTNKGALEMREKVAYWLKKEGIDIKPERFNIMTFNAWGDGIIQEKYNMLGFTEAPRLIEKVDKYDILFSLLNGSEKLEGYDYKNPLMNFRYAKGVIVRLENIFNHIKAHNITEPESLIGKVEDSEIARVMEFYAKYNEALKKNNYIEYQDQINSLMHLTENMPEELSKYNYQHIIVDEFQDSAEAELDLILFLSRQSKFKSLMIVGDDAQCQPAGTKVTMLNGKTANIEDIRVGDKVLSCSVSRGYYPKSDKGAKRVKEISSHIVNNLVSIKTETGKSSEYTPNHRCFAKIHYENNEDKSVVYLMQNSKGQFRVGQTKLFIKGTRDFGLRYRMNSEGAINGWILKVCDASEAWLIEQVCAAKYGIPQVTWTGNSAISIKDIDKLYEEIGAIELRQRAVECLKHFGRDINYPLCEKDKNIHFSKFHITEIRACNLIADIMDVAVPVLENGRWRNSYEQLISVKNTHYKNGITVYGLEIEDYETYVADEILTHNSIFGFRNTSQENILNFHIYFDEVKDINMIENFRSTPEIIALANAVNDLNSQKIDKKLISGLKSGDKPELISFLSYEDEYLFITKKIKELLKDNNPEDFSIIARTKSELFNIEEYLKEENIPYIIDIPEPLLNNSNIHIAKSFSLFLDDLETTQGLFEYLYVITDGFKDMDEDEIKEMMEDNISKIKESIEASSLIGEGDLAKFKTFFDKLEEIKDDDFSSFLQDLRKRNYTFGQLKSYLTKFIEYEDGKTVEKSSDKYSAVTLTTAHTSKGKEFKIVFNTISKYKADNNAKARDEERRTLFVSLTRAKEKLFITHQRYDGAKLKKMHHQFGKEIEGTGLCNVKAYDNNINMVI